MKLGRNDPCHCGSGLKYKRCHHESDREAERPAPKDLPVIGDLVAVRMGDRIRAIHDFNRRVKAPTADPRARLLTRIGGGLEGRGAAEALIAFLDDLEVEISRIAVRHSSYYWLHLARRVPPTAIAGSSDWTVTLYRRILTLAILKHGSRDLEEELVLTHEEGFGSTLNVDELTNQDVIDVFSLEYLCCEIDVAASAFRRVGKGARLVPDDGDFIAMADAETNRLIALLDHRASTYGSLTSSFGMAIGDEGVRTTLDDGQLSVFAFIVNAEEHDANPLWRMTGVRFLVPPNFYPVPLPIERYRNALVRFDDLLRDIMPAGTDALLGSIWGLSTHLIRHLNDSPRLPAQLFGTGYYLTSKGADFDGVCLTTADYLRAWWSRIRSREIDHDTATGLVRQAFGSLTYSTEDLDGISLWDRTPFRLIYDCGDRYLVDVAAIQEAMSGLFREVSFTDAEAGNLKARAFEDEVVRLGQEAQLQVWEANKRLRAKDGREREIDASFVVGDRMMVVECKAFARNYRIDRGEYAALKGRSESLEKYLQQARTLKEFLEADRVGRNYEVPAEVRTIDYCVCTPSSEWISSGADELWLTDETPRICTPEELIALLTGPAGGGRSRGGL